MLLSDRDLKAALASGRMALTPYDEAMVQPSSIDVRLDRFFRVFANHRHTHIDPGMRIGQICVLPLTSASEHPYGASVYGSRYQGQRGPTPSRSYLSFSRTRLS